MGQTKHSEGTPIFSSKLLKLLFGIIIFFSLTYFLFDLLFNISHLVESNVKALSDNWISALIIMGLLIADIIIPVPASIVMIVSGILFGGFLGGIIALAGSLLGALINFQLSRKLGREKIAKWLGDKEYNRLSVAMDKYSGFVVILTRMVPLAMESISTLSGISEIKFKKFFLLNLIGFLPIIFLYSYTGAVYKTNHIYNIFLILVIGFFAPLIIWYSLIKMTNLRS